MCKTFHMKISFVYIWMTTSFNNKSFALGLAFIMGVLSNSEMAYCTTFLGQNAFNAVLVLEFCWFVVCGDSNVILRCPCFAGCMILSVGTRHVCRFVRQEVSNAELWRMAKLEKIYENDIFQWVTQAYSEREIPSSPNRSRTYDLPITSSDDLPLSYKRLVGAKANKLG